MKFTIPILLCLSVMTLLSLKPDENTHPGLGEVKYSILGPEEFKRQHGPGWVLMDDKIQLKGSDINKLLKIDSIPDARGVFIRGLNLDRNQNYGDPFGQENGRDRRIIDTQWDALQFHTHNISHDVGTPPKDNLIDGYHDQYCIAQRDSWRQTDSYSSGGPNVSAIHNAGETRTRNIALYVYIKINID